MKQHFSPTFGITDLMERFLTCFVTFTNYIESYMQNYMDKYTLVEHCKNSGVKLTPTGDNTGPISNGVNLTPFWCYFNTFRC